MVRSPLSFSGRRRSQPSSARDLSRRLAAADGLPPGDPRRAREQRSIARAIAADADLLADPLLAADAQRLRAWSRLVPHVLDDAVEDDLARRTRPIVTQCTQAVQALDDDPATSHTASDHALIGLDSPDTTRRRDADAAAWAIARRRRPVVAESLRTLVEVQAADDRLRRFADWRQRFALVEGTDVDRLHDAFDAVWAARPIAHRWSTARALVSGRDVSDRRYIPGAPQRALGEDAALAARAIAAVAPGLADVATAIAGSVVAGPLSECTVRPDGTVDVAVAHRGTLRSTIMVGHEMGHGVHAAVSRGAPPPTLVGETVACLTSILTADALLRHADAATRRVVAHACADHLFDEVFVSAAVSQFEDRIRSAGEQSAESFDEAWSRSMADLSGPVDAWPEEARCDWARHPSLVMRPGHAISYVWANLAALAAIDADPDGIGRRFDRVLRAGAMDADEQLELLGVAPEALPALGVAALDRRLTALREVVEGA